MKSRSKPIHFEAGGALAPPLGREAGVRRTEVRRRLPALSPVLVELAGESPPSGFLRVLRRRSLLRSIESEVRRARARRPRDLIHIGIGGSALGAEAIFRALAHPHHNLLPDAKRPGPRVHFVDNVDPETLGALLEWVDLGETLVHVVSKSGGTVETAAGFQILREALERRLGASAWAAHCVATTGRGPLRALAEREGVRILPFPEDVGGRFSALTPSGLFTPAVAGIDVEGLLRGGRRMATRLVGADPERDPAAVAAVIAHRMAEERGKPIQVFMPYADGLEPLARWYVQLCAESLGKRKGRGARVRHVGPTPLPARGTTDQHAQVQLFVEGPADKLVTFVRVGAPSRDLRIPGEGPAGYLDGTWLGTLLAAEQQGTAVALARAGRPTVCWELPDLSAESLGQLIVALEMQTAYQAALYGIDAYDQPGVEAGKVAAFALLGREGYAAEREAIEEAAPPVWRV